MKAKSFLALFALSLAWLGKAYAQGDSATSHFSLNALGQYLDYRETQNGSTADSDKGTMWGVSAKWRQDVGEDLLLLADLSYSSTSSATYDGALQYADGTTTPYSFNSEQETIWTLQADLGYKLFRSGGFTLSPLFGLGYRDWIRGQNDIATGDYQEDYHWLFLSGGVDLDLKAGNWRIGFLGKLAYPISPVMQTDLAGDSPSTLNFNIGSVLSYLASATVEYHFPSSDRSRRFFLTLTPFYEHWGIKASNTVYYASQIYYPGYEVGMYEPDSTTNVFGLTLGLGMDANLF